MIEVELSNQQTVLPLDAQRLVAAVRCVLQSEGVDRAEISLAVVDDETIHGLNRRYLDHDYPTDVLSFLLAADQHGMEAQVVVSADTAIRVAGQSGWDAEDELLLYVVHGMLHLTGYDDHTTGEREAMRERERTYMHRLGRKVPAAFFADLRDVNSAPTEDPLTR